jgi:hypothetical protein
MYVAARRAFIPLAPLQKHLARRAGVTMNLLRKDEAPASSMLDFLENPVDHEFRGDYVTATVDQGDVKTIHDYQRCLRERIPIPSSNKRELNTQIRELLTSFGWADEAFEMVVSSSYKDGKLRSRWLEFQIRSFIAHGEPENALRIFDHLVENLPIGGDGKPLHSLSSSLIVHIIHTILRHEIVIPLRTLIHLTEVLASYPEPHIPNRTIRVIVELYANRNAHSYLRRVVMEWARHPARFDPTLLAEVANHVILVAERTKDHKTASSWYSLHRHITTLLLGQHQKKLARGSGEASESHSSIFMADATPYVNMAQLYIKRRPRRPWRAIHKMLQDTMTDGVSPNAAMLNLILRTARAGRRYDRAFEFFEAAYHKQLLSNALPDAYTFCTMWKCLDETRNLRSVYHEHPARPTGAELFNMLMTTHFALVNHSRSDTATPSLYRPRSAVLTKGALNLALAYFMNDQAYVEALIVLRIFLAFDIQPNEKTKWVVNMAILRRAVGEMQQRLKRGYVTCAPGQYSAQSLSWAERLTGMSSEVDGAHDESPSRERWFRLKHSRGYSARQRAFEAMAKSLEQHRSARPRISTSAPRIVKEVWSMTVESSETESATQLLLSPDAPNPSDATKPCTISTHSLLEVVGRCALASQGIPSNADIRVRREILERLVRGAEQEMLPDENAFSAPAIHVNVRAVKGIEAGDRTTNHSRERKIKR